MYEDLKEQARAAAAELVEAAGLQKGNIVVIISLCLGEWVITVG